MLDMMGVDMVRCDCVAVVGRTEQMPPKHRPGRVAAPGERWITVRVPEAAYAQLSAAADAQERSISWICRKVILAALQQGIPGAQSSSEEQLT